MFNSLFPVAFGAPASSSTPAGTTPMAYISGAGAPTDGVTGLNVAAKGTFYLNTTNGQWYTNVGTAPAPVWQIVDQLAP